MFMFLKNRRTSKGLVVSTGSYVSVDREEAFKANKSAIESTIMPKLKIKAEIIRENQPPATVTTKKRR